jgi:DNA-binding IclR family transcriptional regulator
MNESARAGAEPVRVLVKAMAMLELLAEAPGELTLNEISLRLDINKSTCHRILTTLAGGDFVERPSTGSYRIGVGAFRVGASMARRLNVRDRSLPAMQELYRRTGETIFLLVRRGNEAVCVERLDGRYASRHTLRLGGSLPLHLGAGPRILLAAASDQQVEQYLAGPLQQRTSATQVTDVELRDEVHRIRQDWYAVSHDDVELGVKALSVPVHDHLGEVVAALSISGLTAHLPDAEDDATLELLRTCAAQASRAMGHSPGITAVTAATAVPGA